MSFSLETQQKRHVSVLTLAGRLTLGDATETLRNAVALELDGGQKNILLQMSGVNYIDSAGLGVLVAASATAGRRGGRLKLAGLNGRLMDLMQLTKLHTVFDIFENESLAILSFE
jgi:anti-sigma B factor antagonist